MRGRFASKLVRDEIPGSRRTGDPAELFTLLVAKLQEEAAEVARSTTRDNLTEELADVAEVSRAIGRMLGIFPEDVERVRLEKRLRKGGFELGVVQDGDLMSPA